MIELTKQEDGQRIATNDISGVIERTHGCFVKAGRHLFAVNEDYETVMKMVKASLGCAPTPPAERADDRLLWAYYDGFIDGYLGCGTAPSKPTPDEQAECGRGHGDGLTARATRIMQRKDGQ